MPSAEKELRHRAHALGVLSLFVLILIIRREIGHSLERHKLLVGRIHGVQPRVVRNLAATVFVSHFPKNDQFFCSIVQASHIVGSHDIDWYLGVNNLSGEYRPEFLYRLTLQQGQHAIRARLVCFIKSAHSIFCSYRRAFAVVCEVRDYYRDLINFDIANSHMARSKPWAVARESVDVRKPISFLHGSYLPMRVAGINSSG